MKYRKKPVDVTGRQWFPPGDERHDPAMLSRRKGNSVEPPDFRRVGDLWQFSEIPGMGDDVFQFRTANGDVRVNPGDWIVTDPTSGDSWPVRADIFAATYEAVDQPQMARHRDWQGKECGPLGADDVAPHWTCDPHPTGDHDILVVRGWQDFIGAMQGGIEYMLDGADEDELRQGITFTVKLQDWRPSDIAEI